MAQLQNWPTITDAVTPTDTNATRLDKALYASIKESFEDNFDSLTNPTITGGNLIDEVVAARGNKSSLDERLSVSITDGGLLNAPASLMTSTDIKEVPGRTNLCRNGDFEIWHRGIGPNSTHMPSHWDQYNAPTSYAMCGSGETIDEHFDSRYCLRIIHSGAVLDQGCKQDIISSTGGSFNYDTYLDGKKVTIGAFVKCSTANAAQVWLNDGTTIAKAKAADTTEWTWITTTMTYTKGSYLRCYCVVEQNTGATAYFSGVTVTVGNYIEPGMIRPNHQIGTLSFQWEGNPAVDTNAAWFTFPTPTKILGYQAYLVTAATGSAIQGNIRKWDGSWQNMHSSSPETFLATSTYVKSQEWNSGYLALRSFNQAYGTDTTQCVGNIDITQNDSNAVANKFHIDLITLSYGHFDATWWEED
jgi:hypothetical protein